MHPVTAKRDMEHDDLNLNPLTERTEIAIMGGVRSFRRWRVFSFPARTPHSLHQTHPKGYFHRHGVPLLPLG